MSDPTLFDEVAHARWTDPETSHEAAASVKDLRMSQGYVYAVFKFSDGLTDEELIGKYRWNRYPNQSDSGIRTRRSELVRKGLLVDSGERRLTVSGRRSIVWVRR